MRAAALLVCSSAWLGACAPSQLKVGGVELPEADGTVEAPAGPLIVVGKDTVAGRLSGPVRVAADRDAKYRDVAAAADAVRAAGGQPYLLVTYRNRLYALPPPDAPGPAAIRVQARTDGKACISPPDNEEATCVSRKDQQRIDRAFVRRILAQAVRDYGLKHVRVLIDPDLSWADAVRAIDGARTCCGDDSGITVAVELR